MRIAVLSDLHLGARPGSAAFGHDPAAFDAWLATLEAAHDHIVLAGDIYQTDQLLWPSKAARLDEYLAARAASWRVAQRFAGPRYLYLHGNHDEIAGTTGVPDRVQLRHGDLGVLVMHGHQFDPVANRAPWAAAVGTYATAVLRRTGLVAIACALEGRDVAIKHARFGGRDGPYARGAERLARETDARVVVMGHTHAAEVFAIGETVYANSGTCSGGRRQYVSIDLAARWVETRRWPRGGAEIAQRITVR